MKIKRKNIIKKKEFKAGKEFIKKFMKEHLSNKKTNKMNEVLVNEYLDNINYCEEKKIEK